MSRDFYKGIVRWSTGPTSVGDRDRMTQREARRNGAAALWNRLPHVAAASGPRGRSPNAR